MQKLLSMLILCSTILLLGCSNKNEETVSVPDLRPIQYSCEWDSVSVNSITPVSTFETEDDCLKIFPYNNSESYIKIEKILISNNGFWDTVVKEYKDTNNVRVLDNFSYVTTASKVTIGYLPLDDEYAYIVSSDTLPSSYVEKVLEMLCNTST